MSSAACWVSLQNSEKTLRHTISLYSISVQAEDHASMMIKQRCLNGTIDHLTGIIEFTEGHYNWTFRRQFQPGSHFFVEESARLKLRHEDHEKKITDEDATASKQLNDKLRRDLREQQDLYQAAIENAKQLKLN